MSSNTVKTSKMNKADSDALILRIIASIQKNDLLQAKLFIVRVGTLPKGTQSKILRGVFNYFMLSRDNFRWTFGRELNARYGIYQWSMDLETIRIVFLERLIKSLKELESNGKFTPRKVATIPRMGKAVLTMKPEYFDYLFSKGIIELGKSFRFTGVSQSFFASVLYNFRGMGNISEAKKAKAMIDDYRINLDTFIDPDKNIFIKHTNMLKNIQMVSNKFNKDSLSNLTDILTMLNREKSALIDPRHKMVYTSASDWLRIKSGIEKGAGVKLLSEDQIKQLNEEQSMNNFRTQVEIQQKINEYVDKKKVPVDKQDFDPEKETFDLAS